MNKLRFVISPHNPAQMDENVLIFSWISEKGHNVQVGLNFWTLYCYYSVRVYSQENYKN